MTDHTGDDESPDTPTSPTADVVQIEEARRKSRASWPEDLRKALDAVEAGDPGAIMAPDILRILSDIESRDPAEWARITAELKRLKVPRADLKRAIGSLAAAHAPPGGGRAAGKKKPRSINFGDVNRLTENFALLYGTDTVWDGEQRKIMKINALRLAFGNDAVKMWLGSKERRMVAIDNVVFEPGLDLGPDHINLYDGRQVEPEPGDCSVMLELVQHLCGESASTDTGVDAVIDWVLKWCAYPLQHPGAKMQTALIFHGAQGTGKNLMFDCVRDLYGDYGVMVSQNELEDKFTSWLSRKLFIVGDEVVTRSEMYHKKNQLKWMISADKKIPIRAIQQDVRYESNHVNLVFLSNELQPLALEDGDRRYLVVYTPHKGAPDLYKRVADFLAAGGARKFLHYLLTLDLGDFSPSTKPLMTEAKADLISLGLKPAERFMSELMGGFLPIPIRPCSAEQMYQLFRRWSDKMGERFPPPQAIFTGSANKWLREHVAVDEDGQRLPPRMAYKVVKVKDTDQSRCLRCFIPDGCKPQQEGLTEGEWMADCIRDYQAVVDKFCRTARDDDQ